MESRPQRLWCALTASALHHTLCKKQRNPHEHIYHSLTLFVNPSHRRSQRPTEHRHLEDPGPASSYQTATTQHNVDYQSSTKHIIQYQSSINTSKWLIDWAWFNLCTNTIYVIRPTIFTGPMTQPTMSKHLRRVVSHPGRPQSNQAHLTVLQ